MMDDEMETEVPEVVAQAAPPEPKEDNQERNWRNANRVMSEQQEKIQQLERLVQGLAPKPVQEEISEDEIMTFGQYKKLEQQRQRMLESQAVQTAEQIFAARNPDYNDVIEKYLPDLLKKNPRLVNSIGKDPYAHEMVYNMIKDSAMYQKDQKPKEVSSEAKKILKNASQPVPGAAVGRAASKQTSVDTSSMTKKQIIERAKALARGEEV